MEHESSQESEVIISISILQVATLDSSAQKERVLLRRKSSIRRAPSLKKPKPSAEVPTEETELAEDAPSLLEVPKRQNPRLPG